MQSAASSLPRLCAAIVVHNNALALLRTTLVTLRVAIESAVHAGEIQGAVVYVVDNASHGDYGHSVEQLLAELPPDEFCRFEYERRDTNAGFGAGQNSALLAAQGDYHLVLNPDVELAPDALAVGLACIRKDAELVALSPQVRGADGKREFLCKRYPSLLVLGLRAYAPAFVQSWFSARLARYDMRYECGDEAPVDVDIISGCFMLCKTIDLRAVGGFDERFFLYFEDFDLSLRLQQRGALRYQPAMKIVHHGGYAGRKGLRHLWWFVRSGCRFFNLHGWRVL